MAHAESLAANVVIVVEVNSDGWWLNEACSQEHANALRGGRRHDFAQRILIDGIEVHRHLITRLDPEQSAAADRTRISAPNLESMQGTTCVALGDVKD